MSASPRRPPAPSPPERARSVAARRGPVSISAVDAIGGRAQPLLHAVHPSGTVSLLLPDDHPLIDVAAEDALLVVVELVDVAPIELNERTRALLWINGWLRPLCPRAARARAVEIAETDPRPQLLDVGHGASLLDLRPTSLVLADGDGTHAMLPNEFAAAAPDPLSRHESGWLRHLQHQHSDVVELLAEHLPPELRHGRILPLGVDRFGLRLRVEASGVDHDVRLAFDTPVADPAEFGAQLRKLVGCPFLASARSSTA